MDVIQFVDIRSAGQFQEKHVDGSLSLNLKNFQKYGEYILNKNKTIQLIVDEDTKENVKQIKANTDYQWITQVKKVNEISEDKLVPSNTISGEEFIKLENNYILLDVRHPEEITRPAPEKNLVTIPLEMLPESLAQLDKSTPIYTLCGSGTRGTTAASFLVNHRYNAVIIQGGISAIYNAQGK